MTLFPDVGRWVLEHFAEHGMPPSIDQVIAWTGSADGAREALARLHDDHVVVLAGDGSIRMALPFSGVPTDFVVRSGTRSWFANCAWDAMAIPTALHVDAVIESHWSDTRDPMRLEVIDGDLEPAPGYVGFAVPARHWWDDIVFT